MNEGVLKQVAALPSKSPDELREMWQELFGTKAPPYNKSFLARRLAYRLQELAFGGLSPANAERLEDMAEEIERTGTLKQRRSATPPVAGTRLMREYQGETHEVTVLADGFAYRGRHYKSLSAIARQITGTCWNGPLFFGLRQSDDKKPAKGG